MTYPGEKSGYVIGLEGKTRSELDAIISDYHCKVKDSRMQAILPRREDDMLYINTKAAHASVVGAQIESTYFFPPYILSAGSYGGEQPAFCRELQPKKCTRPWNWTRRLPAVRVC